MVNTKVRTIRVEESLWREAQSKAAQEGVPLSHIIRSFLERYVEEK